MTLSDQILAQNKAVIDAMLGHRFIAQIKADELPRRVFHRYLQDEAAFVGTAIKIFANAVAKAPDIAAERHLISVLDALANDQIAYFERVFADLGIAMPSSIPAVEGVTAFVSGMLGTAQKGGYLDIIASMFAAEWLYSTWCAEAARTPSTDPHLAKWVALHAAPEFLHQAQWLREEIDRRGRDLPPREQRRLSGVFGMAMRLEIDFHAASYRAL